MESLKRTLDILIECLEVMHRETIYATKDAAGGVESKLRAARRILKTSTPEKGE